MQPDTALVNELLALVRGTRDMLTIKNDVKAAIKQLFLVEQVLTNAAAQVSYSRIEVLGAEADEANTCFTGKLTETRQLQAA
jgi:hypothetical protein